MEEGKKWKVVRKWVEGTWVDLQREERKTSEGESLRGERPNDLWQDSVGSGRMISVPPAETRIRISAEGEHTVKEKEKDASSLTMAGV